MKTVLSIQAILFHYFLTATISLVRRARFASINLASGMASVISMLMSDESRPTSLYRVYSLQPCKADSAAPFLNSMEHHLSVIDGKQFAATNCNFNSTPNRLVFPTTRILSENLQQLRKLFSGILAQPMAQSGMRAKAVCLHEEPNCNSFLRKTDPDRTD